MSGMRSKECWLQNVDIIMSCVHTKVSFLPNLDDCWGSGRNGDSVKVVHNVASSFVDASYFLVA
jgi:hypothetical protein